MYPCTASVDATHKPHPHRELLPDQVEVVPISQELIILILRAGKSLTAVVLQAAMNIATHSNT